MGLKASKEAPKGDYIPQENIEPGTYPGRLVQVIDLGLQPQRPYQGQEKPPAQEIMVTYELVDCFMVDKDGNELEDKPRWISETFPLRALSNEKAKSTERYLAIDPQMEADGDWEQLVTKAVNVTIVNNIKGEKIYDNVAMTAVMRAKDAAKCPELKNPTKVFSLDEPNMETFNALPQWIRDKITSNLKFKGSQLEKLIGDKPQKDEGAKPAKAKADAKAAEPEGGDDEDAPY